MIVIMMVLIAYIAQHDDAVLLVQVVRLASVPQCVGHWHVV